MNRCQDPDLLGPDPVAKSPPWGRAERQGGGKGVASGGREAEGLFTGTGLTK